MRYGPHPIVLPLELLGRALSGPKQKIQNWEILEKVFQCFLLRYTKSLNGDWDPLIVMFCDESG